MHVLISGGAGFVGSHLGDALLERGHRVTCVDDFSKGPRSNVSHNVGREGFEIVEMDVADTDALKRVGEGVEVVIHLAAAKIPRYESAIANVTTNLEVARSALELARENGAKALLASTSDVYGISPDLPFREDGNITLGPSTTRRWAYAVGKLADEHMAFAYEDDFGLRVVLMRFFGTYGPRQYLSWWGGPQGVFLEAISRGEQLEIHGDGSQRRCFVYISDLVEAIVRAAGRPEADGLILNMGSDEEVSVLGLAELMYRLSGREGDPALRFIPYESFGGNYQDVQRRIPDLTRQRGVLGWEPQVSLEEGTARLWEWYRSAPDGGGAHDS
ncbi:MAG: NAD-dependent epimerase/dehydratase family protein [Thermoleophilaceae bacterium]|nr:NAD-dependent epimerase/dehydratase family protein [Thermoleophilaceae bacterium]